MCPFFWVKVKVILSRKPDLRKTLRLPDFFDNITENTLLLGGTKETAEVGQKLREEIFTAMRENVSYKNRRLNSFANCCREFIETGASKERDMDAFFNANQKQIADLKEIWKRFSSLLNVNYETQKSMYCEYVQKEAIEQKHIEEVRKILLNWVITATKPDDKMVLEIFMTYFKEERIPIYKQIKLRRLMTAAWKPIDTGDPILRNQIKEQIDNLLFRENLSALEGGKFNQELTRIQSDAQDLLMLSLLEKSDFNEKGAFIRICGNSEVTAREEVISMAASFIVQYYLKTTWEEVYTNYCQYVKAKPEFLSADELGCLANAWNIVLVVKFQRGLPLYVSSSQQHPLQITLCNPSETHWMYEDLEYTNGNRANELGNGLVFEIAQILQKIENQDFKLRLLNAVNEKAAYDRRREDCSYIVGVLSTITDFPNVLKKNGQQLSANDAELISKLHAIFEEKGRLKLAPEMIYSLTDVIQKGLSGKPAIVPGNNHH